MLNLRFAFRMLFKAPFVPAVAIISRALGIGANAAIFSLFNQALLRPLPVDHPGQLVNLGSPGPKPGSQSCGQPGDCDVVFSYPMFRDLEREQTVFTGLAAHVFFGANLAYNGQTAEGTGALVSGSYFPVLGLRPAVGRLFSAADDGTIGEPHAVVLSYPYWRARFGEKPDAVGQTMIVNGQSMTIVGVAPDGFQGTTLGAEPKIFVPITLRAQMQPFFKGFDNRRSYWAYLFARLKPGVTIDQARASVNVQYHSIINNVEAAEQKGMSDATLTKFKAKVLTMDPGGRGQSSIHTEAQAPLTLLFAVTGVVLLIACANIANLLLARSAARSGEMAVRLSIGASRSRLIRQLLFESCLLALLGGGAGLIVAHWTLGAISAILPNDATESLSFSLDPSVLLFATALALATGVIFGLFPALHSTRPDLASTLKDNARQPAGARTAARFRSGLVVAQIALSMALLAAAGLFTKSLVNVSRVDLGIRTDNLVTFGIAPELNGYTPSRTLAFFEQVADRLSALPGVTGVTASIVPLLSGDNYGNSVSVEGYPAGPDTDTGSRYDEVSPGFFKTLGIPLLAGREFTRADAAGGRKVAIVNEAFAKKFKLDREAVGKLMARGTGDAVKLDIEIVGLAQDAKYSQVKAAIPPVFYTPLQQDDQVGNATFYVRTSGDPAPVLVAIPTVISKLDANLPVGDMRTMTQQVRENVFMDRLISTLSAAFAGLATVLAAIGLYGVLAFTVSQRTREFGLRMALGADPGRVRGMVLRQVGVMTIIGGLVGLGLAVAIGLTAGALLFEIKGYDPIVLVVSAVALAAVALTAGFIPALRASRIDPMRALRYE
ncbi:MAG: ABC transporter permease [Vicinamibacterales bacterium]